MQIFVYKIKVWDIDDGKTELIPVVIYEHLNWKAQFVNNRPWESGLEYVLGRPCLS